MNCPRCDSMMVKDVFEDLGDTFTQFNGWRCISCGEILDPIIESNRGSATVVAAGRARK
jgi:transposase-like protein